MFSGHNGIKSEINKRKVTRKPITVWKLNNALLNNPWIKEVKMEVRKYLAVNGKATTNRNLWVIAKQCLEVEGYSINYILFFSNRKGERKKIKNLSFYPKNLEKESKQNL